MSNRRKAECMRAILAVGVTSVMLGAAIVRASGASPDQTPSKPAVPTFTKDIAPIVWARSVLLSEGALARVEVVAR